MKTVIVWDDCIDYLDTLYEEEEMDNALDHLRNKFDLTISDAKTIFEHWLDTFSNRF